MDHFPLDIERDRRGRHPWAVVNRPDGHLVDSYFLLMHHWIESIICVTTAKVTQLAFQTTPT